MNQQIADRKAKSSVFLFFLNVHFFNTIVATEQIANLVLPDIQADPSQNQKSHFLPTHL
jgi:hypothetical protein